ncbi:unnamed protein product [Phytomonas sp. Hart1]|nr:unnamed protein product [Phytomonas sp. Hart1]|eukprot:CCW67984.1 unnamed protein product [Phytomonas sp. isolate Hart1]
MDLKTTLKKKIQSFVKDRQALSALPLAEILCELNPNDNESHFLKTKAHFEAREYENVINAVSFALRVDRENVEFITLGMKAAFEIGELKQSVKFANSLIELDKENICAICYIAKCSELCGDTVEAVRYYKIALEKDPFCGEALMSMVKRKLLTPKEISDFIDTLRFPPEAEIIKKCYKAKLNITNMDSDWSQDLPPNLALLQKVRREYERNNLHKALLLISNFLERDPYDRDAVCLYLCTLIDMNATPKLFEEAHFLTKNKSRSELAVYAIGCYYYSLSNFERAGRYFCRATELDCYFAEAWVAYGHCYSKLEEGEQALDVYRRAMNFFPGLTECLTFSGMQYSRIHQWPIAVCFFEESLKKSPNNPLVLNEMGVVFVRNGNLQEALKFFYQAYNNLPNKENPSERQDCILFNLATILRKLGEYNEAIKYYTQYVKCRPGAGHAHCALGFTYHLLGNLKVAIMHYHRVLSIKLDSFCRGLLDRALSTDSGRNISGLMKDKEGANPTSQGKVSFSMISKTFRSVSSAESVLRTPKSSVERSLSF